MRGHVEVTWHSQVSAPSPPWPSRSPTKEGPAYRYHTASTQQTSSSGVVHADIAEPAVLDVVHQVQQSRSAPR